MEIVAVIGTVEPDKLVGIVEKYFAAWRMCVGLARATRTLILSRAELLNALGQELIPKVLCLVLRQLGVTLDAEHERAGVYLTNALTGREPHGNKPLAFPKLEEERGKAEWVKQEAPILLILGNPPYNGFAGMVVTEELSTAYRTGALTRGPGAERPFRLLF